MVINNLKSIIAEAFGVKVSDLNGRGRKQPIAVARQACYYYVRKHFGYPYQAIGIMFDRDHGAIMHGVKQVESLRTCDHMLKEILDNLEASYPEIIKLNDLKNKRKDMSDELNEEVKKSWANEIPLSIRQLELTSHTLEMLRIELEEDFMNCKDQWHDPDTGFNLVSNMKAFKTVQEEIERRICQLRDEE